VKADREACFEAMPHAIAVALGRVRPGAAQTVAALLDPAHQAELLLTLAAMPPRQPVTVPRSFTNTAWTRALSPACDDKTATTAASGPPSASGNARTAALDSTIRGNLPSLAGAARAGVTQQREPLPVIPLVRGGSGSPEQGGDDRPIAAASEPVVTDLGDKGPPAIVPLAPAGGCGGGA
jgi:hypothetical protein